MSDLQRQEENQDQAELFLANHPDFELIDAAPILAARTPLHIEGPYLSLRPDVHGTDGFFAAIFERKKNLVSVVDTKTSEEEVEVEVEVEVKAVKPPAKKRVKASKVKTLEPDLDSDPKDT